MIAGNVDAQGRLTIRVQVSDGGPPYREIDAVVATSLNAELALPRQLISVLGLRLLSDDTFEIGSGVQDTPSYIAYLQWHHGLTPVIAVETLGEPLIGRGLLLGSFLRADFRDGGGAGLYSID